MWYHVVAPRVRELGVLEAGPYWARLSLYQEVTVEKDKAPNTITKSPPPPKPEPPIRNAEPEFVRGRIEPTEKK